MGPKHETLSRVIARYVAIACLFLPGAVPVSAAVIAHWQFNEKTPPLATLSAERLAAFELELAQVGFPNRVASSHPTGTQARHTP